MRVSHILLLALLALSVATARVQHKSTAHKQELEDEVETVVETVDLSLAGEETPEGIFNFNLS